MRLRGVFPFLNSIEKKANVSKFLVQNGIVLGESSVKIEPKRDSLSTRARCGNGENIPLTSSVERTRYGPTKSLTCAQLEERGMLIDAPVARSKIVAARVAN